MGDERHWRNDDKWYVGVARHDERRAAKDKGRAQAQADQNYKY